MQVPTSWVTQKRSKANRPAASSASSSSSSGVAIPSSASVAAPVLTAGHPESAPHPPPSSNHTHPPIHNNVVRKKARNQHEYQEPVPMRELARSISHSIIDTVPSRVDDNVLDLSTVLSGVAYREILQNLFGDGEIMPANVPVVSKAYEEAFLRECIGPNERPCVMGSECEGQHLSKVHRFTLTEFLLPGQERTEPQMCVLCCRKHTQKLFYDLLYSPPGTHVGIIQRYGVVVGVPGEYASSATLIVPATGLMHAMPFPSVAHCRANYNVVVRNTTRFVVQTKSLDFHMPSHGEPSAA